MSNNSCLHDLKKKYLKNSVHEEGGNYLIQILQLTCRICTNVTESHTFIKIPNVPTN